MANYFTLTLDTTPPASPSISLDGGASSTTNDLLTITLGTTDADTTGYQMQFWGDIDATWAASNGLVPSGATSVTEANASWIPYSVSQQIVVSSQLGLKTIYFSIRDDVWNQTLPISGTITITTTSTSNTLKLKIGDAVYAPIVTGENTCTFVLQVWNQ